MSKFNNKEDFKDRPEIYSLLTELEVACDSTDSLKLLKIHVLLDRLKQLNISFKAEEKSETITNNSLTQTETSSIIN